MTFKENKEEDAAFNSEELDLPCVQYLSAGSCPDEP